MEKEKGDDADSTLQYAYWTMGNAGDRSEHGRNACEVVLRGIAEKKLTGHETPFPKYSAIPVLHVAMRLCSAAIVRRLVMDLQVPASTRDYCGRLPMHIAAVSLIEPLEKCMLLPVADLGKRCGSKYTPLELCIREFAMQPRPRAIPLASIQVLQWMLQQPECLPGMITRQFMDILSVPQLHVVKKMLVDAVAERRHWARRWSPARAAWLNAVVTNMLA
jgi:hypothetical protein